jgi:tRNA splicing endonuclease
MAAEGAGQESGSGPLPEEESEGGGVGRRGEAAADAAPVEIVHVRGGKFVVWTVEEGDRLRRGHHLAVTSLGPPMSKTNLQARCGTLPLLLRQEEVCLCVDEGFGRVVPRAGASAEEALPPPRLETRLAQLRYVAMRTLWRQGCYMTSGIKFGGDLLVYPDDPSRTHGPFLVILLDGRDEAPLHPLSLLATSRVSNTSLKVLVYAIVSTDPAYDAGTSQEIFAHAAVRYVMFTRRFPRAPVLDAAGMASFEATVAERARTVLAASSSHAVSEHSLRDDEEEEVEHAGSAASEAAASYAAAASSYAAAASVPEQHAE